MGVHFKRFGGTGAALASSSSSSLSAPRGPSAAAPEHHGRLSRARQASGGRFVHLKGENRQTYVMVMGGAHKDLYARQHSLLTVPLRSVSNILSNTFRLTASCSETPTARPKQSTRAR